MSLPPIALAVAASILLAAAAPAPPQPQAPYWSQTPSRAQWDAALTAAGVKAADRGRGIVSCSAKADGSLEACRVVVDNPAGAGFGKAALSVAPFYRVDMAGPRAPAVGEDVWFRYEAYPADTQPDWLRKPTERDLMAVW